MKLENANSRQKYGVKNEDRFPKANVCVELVMGRQGNLVFTGSSSCTLDLKIKDSTRVGHIFQRVFIKQALENCIFVSI